MTEKQATLANLKIAREKLIEFADYYPTIKKNFNMSTYGYYAGSRIEFINSSNCSTCGCLLSNISSCFKLKKSDFELGYFNYWEFKNRLFPIMEKNTELWHFLFSCNWVNYQPTFEQAIERLDWAIKHKLDIPEWMYQKESFK